MANTFSRYTLRKLVHIRLWGITQKKCDTRNHHLVILNKKSMPMPMFKFSMKLQFSIDLCVEISLGDMFRRLKMVCFRIELLSSSVSIDIANDIFIQATLKYPTTGRMWWKKRKRTEKKTSYHRVDHHKYFWKPLLKRHIVLFIANFCLPLRPSLRFDAVQLNSRPFVCNIRFIFAINFSMKLYAVVSFDSKVQTIYRPPHSIHTLQLFSIHSVGCFL